VTDDVITWVFDEDSFSPVAKLRADKKYSILSDYLGTPTHVFNDGGEVIWEAALDSYGKLRIEKGTLGSCPFRYQGQYEDFETGLYYNRFRYYSPDEGSYISQDPIDLDGGFEFYEYVRNPNVEYDPFGLATYSKRVKKLPKNLRKRPKWRKSTKDHLNAHNPKRNGKFVDVKTGKVITGKKAIGHQGETWREYQDNPANRNKTRKQVSDDYNNVKNLGYEDASTNSSNGARSKGLEN
jgi:RHS repeat-associated protein